MKIGDTVIHKKRNWIGKIISFNKRNGGVLVDLSDDQGVLCRIIHIDNLEVVYLKN